ncbi:MAG: N-acetylmuramoyl-L-alanine amidase, partial [Candidatus Desulforudis sp.]|nr:N-acetylmuramoyl-L-alanine amidase [Desulforudis sp.]
MIHEPNWRWTGELKARSRTERMILHHDGAPVAMTAPQVHQGHLNRGFHGIGYHYFVETSGQIVRGRPEWAEGAHCKGQNHVSIGICLSGNFTRHPPADAQLRALAWLVNDIRRRHSKLPLNEHKDFAATQCPGHKIPWAKFFRLLVGQQKGEEGMFTDLDKAWYPHLIEQAAELGLVAGYPDGTFRPKQGVTREELVYILLRMWGRVVHHDTIVNLVAAWKRSVVFITNHKI